MLQNEGAQGGSVCDPGLLTKYGISSRYNPDVDVERLTLEGAVELYKRRYWKAEYDEIPGEALAIKLFDFAVNAGHARAHRTLQRALNHLLPARRRLKVDGVLGERTLEALTALPESAVLDEFTVGIILFYAGRPHWERFKWGWVRRAVRRPR